MDQLKDLLAILENDLKSAVKSVLLGVDNDRISKVLNDLKAPTQKVKEWSQYLKDGEIDQDEFESLVRGAFDLAQMKSLTAIGLAKVKIDELQDRLLSAITSSVSKIV